jgi:hypothetical protein
MYDPPPCRKRKVRATGWSAQMYTAFVGVDHSWPGWNALRSFPIQLVLEDFFRIRVWRALGSTVVSSQCSTADLAGNHQLRSSNWAVDVGIAYAISKPGSARRHLQASTGGR